MKVTITVGRALFVMLCIQFGARKIITDNSLFRSTRGIHLFKSLKLHSVDNTYTSLYTVVGFQAFLSLGLPFPNLCVCVCEAELDEEEEQDELIRN